MTDDDWNDVIGVCLTGTFLCVREAARLMTSQALRPHHHRRITRLAGQPRPGQLLGGQGRRRRAHQVRGQGARPPRSHRQRDSSRPHRDASLRELATFDQIAERAIRDNSIKRIGQPGDVAAAVLYLASPQAGFITGEVIHVSGGRFG